MQASRAAFAVSGAGVVRAAVPATAAASRTRRSTVGSVAALSAVGVAAVAVGVASLVRPQPGRGADAGFGAVWMPVVSRVGGARCATLGPLCLTRSCGICCLLMFSVLWLIALIPFYTGADGLWLLMGGGGGGIACSLRATKACRSARRVAC